MVSILERVDCSGADGVERYLEIHNLLSLIHVIIIIISIMIFIIIFTIFMWCMLQDGVGSLALPWYFSFNSVQF